MDANFGTISMILIGFMLFCAVGAVIGMVSSVIAVILIMVREKK